VSSPGQAAPIDSATRSSRLRSLDGLRGLAATIVVFHHLSLTIPGMLQLPGDLHPPVGSALWWFTSTPAELFIAGPEAVLVFFVLSGLVVIRPALRRADFDWIAYYPQRIARLMLPVLASLVLAVGWIVSTPQSAQTAQTAWLAASSYGSLRWQSVVQATDLLFGDININNPLWTLRWELVFSLLLPIYVVLIVVCRNRWWLIVPASVAAVAIGTVGQVPSLQFLPVFLVGSMLALRVDDLRERVAAAVNRVAVHLVCTAVLIVSLLLLDVHWTLWGLLGGSPRFQGTALSLEFLGALGLVALAAVWFPFERMLELGFFQWLGRISFSLYLVHVPAIIGINALMPGTDIVLRFAVSLVVVFVLAVLFSRFVEQPSHRLSRRIGSGASTAVRAFLAAR
jgi:peptidoglycan/LPS O-acetylase OafA/YrhL